MRKGMDRMSLPKCDMKADCDAPICYIDDKGYLYCKFHGLQRRQSRPCMKLHETDLLKLHRGEPIAWR
jgi:hypothetical protein